MNDGTDTPDCNVCGDTLTTFVDCADRYGEHFTTEIDCPICCGTDDAERDPPLDDEPRDEREVATEIHE